MKNSTSNTDKPLASLSLDLDNQWSYMKTYGKKGWDEYPSYFNIFIPYVLDILQSFNLKITFFIVGKDAALAKNRDLLRLISSCGHEIGNHSFNHEPWLNLYTKDEIEKEVLETAEVIYQVTGENPVGFRGPGFSWSRDLFEVLASTGYVYDSTTLPTYLGPLARAYYFRNPNLSQEDKDRRKDILGGFSQGMRPVKPYYWNTATENHLLEIPVTTIPIIKTPFHLSYLLVLSRASFVIMLFYLKIAITMCRLSGIEPNFIIHPTDLLDSDQVPEMRFFPGMELSSNQKVIAFNEVIRALSKHFNLVNISTRADYLLQNGNLKTINIR
jgi:hypothetical protein